MTIVIPTSIIQLMSSFQDNMKLEGKSKVVHVKFVLDLCEQGNDIIYSKTLHFIICGAQVDISSTGSRNCPFHAEPFHTGSDYANASEEAKILLP